MNPLTPNHDTTRIAGPVNGHDLRSGSGSPAADRARRLRELHRGPEPLVLANAWDAGSAALFAALPGVRALATTSAGIAAGYAAPDGERLDLDHVLGVVARITDAVHIPVSVDLETGYGRSADEVADTVASVIEAGAAGINLEDADPDPARQGELFDPRDHAERLIAAGEAARSLGVPIVVNARTDVYWVKAGPPERRMDETVRRLHCYADAGADCVFVPGFPGPGVDRAEQVRMVGELLARYDRTPVNLLAGSTLLTVADLAGLGVRRLSVGSALYRLSLAAARDAFDGLLRTGRPEELADAQRLGYDELQRMR